MSVSTPAAPRANGAVTALNVVAAPREAFETLRIAPMWGWAFVIAAVLSCIGQYLSTPATIHALQGGWPAMVASNPGLAGLTPDQQQRYLNGILGFTKWAWIFSIIYIFLGALVTTIVMLIFKAIGRGDAGFKQLWCAAMNIAVVSLGVYSILNGLIALVRGAASYNSTADAYRAIPSLAWLVPHASIKATAFLAAFSVTGIWSAVLIAMAMIYVARTSKVTGSICGLTVLVISGLLISLGAR